MEINGVRFSAGFDREGLFKGHSASIVLDWLNETGKPSGWGTGKEVKIDNLSLSDLKVLSDSINKYIKTVEKSNRNDESLRQALLCHAQKTTYFEKFSNFDRGYCGVMESLALGLQLSDMSVNEIIARIRERKNVYLDFEKQSIVDDGFIPDLTKAECAMKSMAFDGYNAAMKSIENIIGHFKAEAADANNVGNWKPKLPKRIIGQSTRS